MKIGPALPPPMPRQTPEAEPAQRFADVLAALDGPTRGFDEPGMFGLGRPTAAPESLGIPAGAQPEPVDAMPVSPIQADATRAGDAAKPSAAPAPRSAAAPAPACDLPTARPHVLRHAPGPFVEAVAETIREAADALEPDLAQPPGRARARPTARQPGPSLILSEKDGQATVVAGGTQLDARTRAILRRIVRTMLGRHGLSLAHFQLNGAPIAPDSLESTGGSHGTRAR